MKKGLCDMVKKNYKYMLRYTVQPGHHVEEHLDELVEFCRQAKIDDVMFFINGEQLNQGHLTLEETKPWLDVIARGKRLLDDISVTTSINPWPTLLHDDKGRTFRNGVKFRWMVDAYGHSSRSVACPMCPDWRKYITEMYAYYASVKPYILWVEDDFRHFNHGAELVWGGCFCDAHMEEFSRRAGKKLTRQEFIEGILKKGEPHPYRRIWLETARDEMIENARLIGEAVHKVSPETKIGLMSSGPAVHCAEGRSWEGVLKGLAGDTPMVNRPHLDAYVEVTAQEYLWRFNVISRVTRTFTPLETEIYPELENCADLRYTKSHKLMGLQLDTSLVLDAKGITLNIFDMMGNGVIMKEGLQNVLADRKDFLESIRGLGLSVDKQKGVKVPVDPEASFRLHTKHGRNMEELYPREYFWGGLLSSYGIPTVYTTEKNTGTAS